jgi:hypothetical protein
VILPFNDSRFGNIEACLELGKWSPQTIEGLLYEGQAKYATGGERLHFYCLRLLGVPFAYESLLPVPSRNKFRVRFQSFDCVTLIYTLIAMAGARSFEEFMSRLVNLRYAGTAGDGLDSDPEYGNILDFACESLIRHAVHMGFLTDITAEVAGGIPLMAVTVDIRPARRHLQFDTERRLETPKLGGGKTTGHFIPSEALGQISLQNVRSGDIALLTKGAVTKEGQPQTNLIYHVLITDKRMSETESPLSYIHATKHFAWRPRAGLYSPPKHTGIFYDNARRREQIGVGMGGVYAGDELIMEIENQLYYGYIQENRRSMLDYVGQNFCGAMFMRVEDRS